MPPQLPDAPPPPQLPRPQQQAQQLPPSEPSGIEPLLERTARLRLEVRAAEQELLHREVRREAADAERVAQLEDELTAARRHSDEQRRELEAERGKACRTHSMGPQPLLHRAA